MRSFTFIFLVLAPLATFAFTYYMLDRYLQPPSLPTPSVIGTTVTQAAQRLGQHHLSMQVVRTVMNADLPDGTILQQRPQALQRIKAQQTVYCTVSAQPAHIATPSLIGMHKEMIERELNELQIPVVFYELESTYPAGTAIAQLPQEGQPLTTKKVICYISKQSDKPHIFPRLIGMDVTTVQEFFAYTNHSITVFHEEEVDQQHSCEGCVITDQRPLAGSSVQPHKRITIQLNARPKEGLS